MEKERAYKKLPVFKKAKEIAEITRAIAESMDEKKDELHMREQMLANAYMLAAKIANAEGGNLYTLKMEQATIIKMSARELLAETSFCKVEGLSNPEYLQLLRDELEKFRLLYLDWVRSFDKFNDIEDEWTLYD